METVEEGENGASVDKDTESWHQLTAAEDPSQLLGQTSGLLETDYLQGITLYSEGQTAVVEDLSVRQTADRIESLQLDLQDSCLSPALTLIPQGNAFVPSESTLLHQTDFEFFPLRGSPDLSIASERYPQTSRLDVDGECNLSHRSHEQASLSQHHLGTMSAILEDASSCCSLSQHSLSPNSNYQATQIDDEKHSGLKNDEEEGKLQIDADLEGRGTACSSSSGNPVCSFQKLLEKDIGVASNSAQSSSEAVCSQTDAVLSLTNTPENQIKDFASAQKQDPACTATKKPQLQQSEGREQPQGISSSLLSQRRTMGSGRVSLSTRLSVISNITVRSTSKQTDAAIDLPLRQLNFHNESSLAALDGKNQTENTNTPVGQNVPLASGDGVFTAELQRARWSSGKNQTADGSFLTSQPVFQSTPAVLLGRGAPPAANCFPVYSHQKMVATSTQNSSPKPDDIPALALSYASHQINAEVKIATSLDAAEAHTESHLQHEIPHGQAAPSLVLDVPVLDHAPLDQPTLATLLPTSEKQLKDQETRLSKGRVHSLPSLNYVQKVDAWTANQSSSSSFYDSLSSQGDSVLHLKYKERYSVSEAKTQQQLPDKTSLVCRANNNTPLTQTGSDVLPIMDVEVAEEALGSPSPFTHSYSHSSLGTVITPTQPNELQQNQPSLAHTDAFSPGSTEAKSALSTIGTNNERPAEDSGTSRLKPPALQGGDQYSGININNNTSNMVSNLQASVGAASSVVSLELDNYAPYWTSRPGSPRRPPEFNIEDRIPLYLHNLGINQSPSTILNPFTHRGPIREPEFSPTDLCTIKGSIGTPTKSIQPSDGDSLKKETFSSSSMLSADSSASITQLFIQKSIEKPAKPASPDSVRMTNLQTHISLEPHSPSDNVPQIAATSLREGSYGLSTEVSLKSATAPGTWERDKDGDSSLVGSGTLQEIRRLLGHAESLVSSHDSVASLPESHFRTESGASFLSLHQNTQAYHDDSFLSVDGRISLVLARSSSDSALKESSSSSSGLLELSTNFDLLSKEPLAPSLGREENPKSRDFRVAPRRAEPEGCSAADPDKVGPASLSVAQGNISLTSDGQQQSQDNTKNADFSSLRISPTHSQTEGEMCVSSDASSEHSLASKVAKLLQSESSASVVTSRSSTTEPDENRAREWIMMKVSGANCEALELNAEDRRRIEEIKRELLLHTKYTKSSSDSESSMKSNVGTVPQPAVGFAAVRSAEDRLSEQLQRVSQIPLDPCVSLRTQQENRVSQTGIKKGSNPQTVTQCLQSHNMHGLHNDFAVESNSYTTIRSSEDWTPHTQMTNRVTKNEVEKGRVGSKKEIRAENVHRDSEKKCLLPIPESTQSVTRRKPEFPPGMESDSALGQKPCFSSSHFTPSMELQQNTDQRPYTPATDSCSYPEQLTGSHIHYTDSLNTSVEVLPPVSSTYEEQQVSVSSETSLSKDRNADQAQTTGKVYSQMPSRYPQAITSPQRLAGPSRPSLVNTPAIPTLLPYKPHGSSELFYMPQTVPELSPNCSDTTVESSHPGSDDAVPPQFTPEVLGSRELVDENVAPKHKEGIYSKRAKMKRESAITGKGFYDQKGNTGLPHQHSMSVVSENEQVAEQTEEGEAFTPLHMEADYSTTELLPYNKVQIKKKLHNRETGTLPLHTNATREKRQNMKAQDIGAEIGSSLDQLWHRFNERYNLQESRATNDLEISLLERLERLSRLLHNTSPPHTPKQAHSRVEKSKNKKREHDSRRTQKTDPIKKETERKRNEVGGGLKTAWEKEFLSSNQTLMEKKQQEKDRYRYPAERDDLETSSSQSTIDTQRLIRAFGPHRVVSGREGVAESQTLKPSDGLLKLHNTIKQQKQGHGKDSSENRLVSVATETSNTDDSMASDTLSSSSTYTPPSHRGTGRYTSSKKAKVKLISRSIQAGDLEIVVNGTRRFTRDVGTTFPSPGSDRVTRASSAAPVQTQSVLRKQAPNKHTCYSNGLSWFVSADELKWDARKENNPQTDAEQSGGQAWFEPYTRTQPWREPFRERHLQVEIETPPAQKTQSENNCGRKPSAMVRLSLQEALEARRPEFVSRSRERMKRLCLLVEERKMQAVFNKEREELFNCPTAVQQPKAAPPPPPLPSKRVIPVSEMIQRSKRGVQTPRIGKTERFNRIYSKLPEVQRRKEEERRKAEYHTYRLNAQLFNKKITNRVLGKRTAWQ